MLAALAGRLAKSHPPLRFPSPPTGWCSWYCFGPRVTAQQVLDNLDDDREERARPEVRPDRRRLPAGDGGLAGDRSGLRRRRPGRTEEDPRARLRARDLGRAVRRGGGLAALPPAPRLVREGRGRPAAAVRPGHVRRLAPRALVRGRRHAPRSAAAPRARLPHDARELGRARTSSSTPTSGARSTAGPFHDPKATRIEAYRRGMEAVRRGAGDGLHPRLQPPDLALARAHPRLAQLERHQAHLGAASRAPAARTSCGTGRTAVSGGTTRTRSS